MIDSTIVRAHQHSAGATKKDGEDQAIGRSKGGLSTKIHTLVDALGNPVGFFLTPGQAHDLQGADALLPDMKADTLLADKAFDADQRVIEPLQHAGKTCVIPPKSNRKKPRALRQRDLQGPPSHRKLLLQAQAIPRHRHSLRQDRQQFPRRNPPRRRYHLAQLRTGPRSTYENNGYKPDFDNLPLEAEYRAAKEKLGNVPRPKGPLGAANNPPLQNEE